MLKKEEVYLEVGTAQEADELKKVLSTFGQDTYSEWSIEGCLSINGLVMTFDKGRWCNTRRLHKGKHKVSIKDLYDILSAEMSKNIFYNKRELSENDYKNKTWYTYKDGEMIFLNKSGGRSYGFTSSGYYRDEVFWFKNFKENGFHNIGEWRESTEDEVKEALINEAKNRGLIEGSYMGNLYRYCLINNRLAITGKSKYTLFYEGLWATKVTPVSIGDWVKYSTVGGVKIAQVTSTNYYIYNDKEVIKDKELINMLDKIL